MTPETKNIAPPTRIALVMASVRARIAARTLAPGARLPSVRAAADTLGVSVSTVVEAYERLAAEGLISARRGAGFFVCGPTPPLALAAMGPKPDRDVDPLWISREALDAQPGALKPGCGWLPASWMYEAGLRQGLRSLARAQTSALCEYATALGSPPLRALLSRRLAATGIEAAPDHILLTHSGTQAIDLICRLLLVPGDTVLLDDPCYFNFRALLTAHRVQVVSVPYTPTGPDVAAFARVLKTHKPRLYITNSAIHNPTGAVLSAVTAHRLLTCAESSDLVIVEDDIFADFETVPAPRLAAFDGLSRVISTGSFSKSLSASARCGYIAARPDWIDSLTDLQIATSFGGARMDAELVLTALTGGGYRRHMESVRQRLAAAMARTLTRLARLDIQPWTQPREGMFVWCRLPQGVEAADLARACLGQGVVLAPGNAFSPARDAGAFMRFNVAQCMQDDIFDVLARGLDAAARAQNRPATGHRLSIVS